MTALIDGDIIAYRCAASCEPTKGSNTKPAKLELEDLNNALARIDVLMERIKTETSSLDHKIWIGGKTNFRTTIYPEYKANRIGLKRPTHLEACREHLVRMWDAKVTEGVETDDMLGMSQTDETIICSIDKDLLQIPGKHYNFVKYESIVVSPLDGLRSFYRQIITGDASDNIPAFDGAFRTTLPKFVNNLLIPLSELYEEDEMYDYVTDVYGGDVVLLDRNASLLYILRKEGEHWQPPKTGQPLENDPS
jgi:hypothetical protein